MTKDVLTPASFAAGASKLAPGGGEIRLAPGEYPAQRLKNLKGSLAFVADDPASPPRFTRGLTLDKPMGVTLRGLDIDISSATANHAAGLTVYGGDGLTIDGGRVLGLEKPDGVRWGRGIVVSDVSNLTVDGTVFEHLFRGIVVSSAIGVLLDRLDLFDLGSDGINIGQVAGMVVRRSQIVGFAPVGEDHPDGIQIMTGASGAASSDILLEDTLIACGIGKRAQGIFCRSENPNARHAAITVRNCVLINVGNHGIAIGDTDGVLIESNTLLFQLIPPEFQPKGGFANASWIKTDTSSDVVVRDNAAMRFILGGATKGEGSNVVIPAATEEQVRAAIAAWRAKFRPEGEEPAPEQPAERDELREILSKFTVAKNEPLKTKGRLILDFKTPAEGAAALAAVQALAVQ
jgi:hypothetical protein